MGPIKAFKHKRHVTLRVLVIQNDDLGTRRSGTNHASTADVWALAFDYGQKFVFRGGRGGMHVEKGLLRCKNPTDKRTGLRNLLPL